jgi:hypothetical protein
MSSIASAVGGAVRAVSRGTRGAVHHSSGGGIAHAVNTAVRAAVHSTGRASGVPHAGRYIARGRRSYARGVARQRSAQRQAARQAQRQEVRRAQNEVLKALKAKPKKLPPFRLVDPITKQGRLSTSKSIQKLTRKGASTLVASNKPYVPKPKVIYDQKSHALFHYRQPSAQTVQSNVRKLFKGNPNQRGQAVARLRAMGVVTGGKPSQKYFKYVGHLTPTVGAINNRQGLSEHVASLTKSGPPDQGVQHYKGTTLQGQPFVAVSTPGRPITMVQGQVSGAQIAHDIGGAAHFIAHGGQSPGYENLQASLLPAPVRALRHGVLSGTNKALGFAGEYLNRPLAASESLIGHGLVDAGLINGKTARKIRRSRGPLTAFLHGQRKQDVHGGDITQGLLNTRKLGIVADVALDPTMWVGAAAAPETGGTSALLALERIGSRGGKAAEALRSDRILALTNQAHKTGEYKHLNVALKDVAKQHGISLRNLKGFRGRRLLKDLNRADTRALLHDLHGQKAVTISGKRGLTRRVLRRQAPQRQLHVVGKPGLDAVTAIAKTVHAQRIRPGIRLQAMTPLGRRIGRPLDLPLPKKLANAKIIPIASQRQRDRLRLQATQQIESKYRALHEQQVAPLLAQREAARLAGDVAKHNKLDAAVHEVSSALDVARTAELKKARMIPTQSLHSITDRANATRLQRQTSQFAQSYGRTVKHRLDEAVLKATQTEGLSAKAAALARQRVQLHLWEQEATGSTAVLDRVMPLTPQEQRIKANLEHVYADSFRQAKEVGILDRGVPNYGGTRIWNDKGLDPTNPTQVESVVQGLEASRGMSSAFTHHRSAASVFDLASPAQVAHQIKKLSKVPLTDAEATHLANELWHTGHARLHTELIARDLERGATVDFNKLSSQQQRHVINATRLTPPGQADPVPLFHVAQPGAEIRKVTLNPAAERHYNFSPTAYEGLSAESARAAKLKSALNDRNRVADILAHTTATGDHLKALEAAHVTLSNRVSALDRSVTSLPQSVQDAIAATHGVEGAPGYVKVPATEANRHGQAMVDELASRMDKIQAHAAATTTEAPRYMYHVVRDTAVSHKSKLTGIRANGLRPSDGAGVVYLWDDLARAREFQGKSGGEILKVHVNDLPLTGGEGAATRGVRGPVPSDHVSSLTGTPKSAVVAQAANGDMAHQLELKLLRNDFAKARARLDPQINKAFQEHMILRQSGGNGLSPGLMHSTVLNDANVLYVVPEGVKAPAGLPMPRFAGEPGPFDDVLDYGNRLPDFREPDLLPVLDPKLSNFYRTRAQARMSAFQARWHGIDEAVGRSTSEVQAGTLVRRSKDYYYDPKTHTEYKLAEVGNGTPPGIAPDRLWPTQTISDANAELAREGQFDGIVKTGIESGTERMLASFRYGFTTPFPAFHLRNFVTDLLKSLQADPGVAFHPITNAKLTLAAGGVKHHLAIRVPGHGRIPVEEFLLLSETIGVRSGHHVSELLQGAGKAAWSESRIRRFLTKAGVGPNSFFGHMATGFGVKREDVMRFNTFVQRMRRNGGDAADAAMYMIQHHFNYNDLSAVERRFARNTFLFYTWYRKNIPLQLMELVRRPGFFSAISSTYNDLQRGETPINQDWSKISPWLPDMSGEYPVVSTIPDYYKDSLSAMPLPWNGHAVMVGFGAPWADLQILSQQGPRQLLGMTQPAIGVLYQLFAKQDILTGRSFAASEPGGLANTLNGVLSAFGTSLPKDKYGNAILPFWANVLGNSVPILGRGAGAARGMSPFTDQGQLQTLGKRYSWLTGANVYVSPKPGSVRYNAAVQQIVKGRAAERGKLIYDLRNLPKHDLRKALHKFDKQTHVWAKDKHISSSVLKKVQRSGFYQGSRSSGGSSKPGLTIPKSGGGAGGLTIPKSGGGAGGLTIPKSPSGSAPLIVPHGRRRGGHGQSRCDQPGDPEADAARQAEPQGGDEAV